jgi:hypothetical protein
MRAIQSIGRFGRGLSFAWALACVSAAAAVVGGPGCSREEEPAKPRVLSGGYSEAGEDGIAITFATGMRYTLVPPRCDGAACVERGTYSFDAKANRLVLNNDTGAVRTFRFEEVRVPKTSVASLRTKSTDEDGLTPTDPGDGCALDDEDIAVAQQALRPLEGLVGGGDGPLVEAGAGGPRFVDSDGGTILDEEAMKLLCDAVVRTFALIETTSGDPTGGGSDDGGGADQNKWGKKPTRNLEKINYNMTGSCPGAVGPNCSLRKFAGFPVGNTCDKDKNDPRKVICDVSIGSLLHDTCCGSHPSGVYCNGPGTPTKACQAEWDRAQWDYANNNYWRKRFTVEKVDLGFYGAYMNAQGRPVPAVLRDADGEPLCIPGGRQQAQRGETPYSLRAKWEEPFCCSQQSEGNTCK